MGLSGLDRRLLPALGRLSRGGLADRGPFRLLRDVPQLGLVLVLAVLAGDLALVGQRYDGGGEPSPALTATATDPGAAPGEGPTGGPDPGGGGPLPGTQVADYLAARAMALQDRAAQGRGTAGVAVVSFTSYLRPSELAGILGPGLSVAAVLVHVPVKAAQPVPTPGALLRPTVARPLGQLLGDVAAQLTKEGAANQHQGDTVTIYNEGNKQEKQGFYDEAARQALEAQTLRGDGTCVYAAVVSGTLGVFATAADRPMVRLVDPAPENTDPATLAAHGLLPEDTQVVQSLMGIDGFPPP